MRRWKKKIIIKKKSRRKKEDGIYSDLVNVRKSCSFDSVSVLQLVLLGFVHTTQHYRLGAVSVLSKECEFKTGAKFKTDCTRWDAKVWAYLVNIFKSFQSCTANWLACQVPAAVLGSRKIHQIYFYELNSGCLLLPVLDSSPEYVILLFQ